MIKAVTTRNTKKGDRRTLVTDVEIDGTRLELLHEFMGILNSLEDVCPEVIIKNATAIDFDGETGELHVQGDNGKVIKYRLVKEARIV